MPFALCFDFVGSVLYSAFRTPQSAFEWANFFMDNLSPFKDYHNFIDALLTSLNKVKHGCLLGCRL
jgi:hypothetical protein